MGKFCFVLSVLALLAWLIHASPWTFFSGGDQKPLPEQVGWVKHTHYLSMDRAFWSAILGGLTLALAGEGFVRASRRRRGLD